MDFTIRKISENDIATVVGLMREFAAFEGFLEYFEITEDKLFAAMFAEEGFVRGLIAFADEVPAGYALYYPSFASFRGQRGLFLEDLFIKSQYRRHALGLKFLREIARSARLGGFSRIDFQVLDSNAPAIAFYTKHGAVSDEDTRHFKFTDSAFDQL